MNAAKQPQTKAVGSSGELVPPAPVLLGALQPQGQGGQEHPVGRNPAFPAGPGRIRSAWVGLGSRRADGDGLLRGDSFKGKGEGNWLPELSLGGP